jgi:hypothetical protein
MPYNLDLEKNRKIDLNSTTTEERKCTDLRSLEFFIIDFDKLKKIILLHSSDGQAHYWMKHPY